MSSVEVPPPPGTSDDIPNTFVTEHPEQEEFLWNCLLYNFGIGKSVMLQNHKDLLIRERHVFFEAPDGTVDVTGGASGTGNPAFNLTLSKNRAKEVCRFLQHELFVPKEKFVLAQRDKKTGEAVGFGGGVVNEPGKEDDQARAVSIFIWRSTDLIPQP